MQLILCIKKSKLKYSIIKVNNKFNKLLKAILLKVLCSQIRINLIIIIHNMQKHKNIPHLEDNKRKNHLNNLMKQNLKLNLVINL